MIQEYNILKNKLSMYEDNLLTLFENYCNNSYQIFDRMEWSCKFYKNSLILNRFIHASKIISKFSNLDTLNNLLTDAEINHQTISMNYNLWDNLLKNLIERIYIGYSGPSDISQKKATLRIGFGLKEINHEITKELFDYCYTKNHENIPPGNPGIIIGWDFDKNLNYNSRIYVHYDSNEYHHPDILNYLKTYVGKKEFNFLSQFPRCAITFKKTSLDMLYVMVANSRFILKNYIDIKQVKNKFLKKRLSHLIWFGKSITTSNSKKIDEFNLYIKLK